MQAKLWVNSPGRCLVELSDAKTQWMYCRLVVDSVEEVAGQPRPYVPKAGKSKL